MSPAIATVEPTNILRESQGPRILFDEHNSPQVDTTILAILDAASDFNADERAVVLQHVEQVHQIYLSAVPSATADELEAVRSDAVTIAIRSVRKARPTAPCCAPDEQVPCGACVSGVSTDDEQPAEEESDEHYERLPQSYFDAREAEDALEQERWEEKCAIPRFKTTDDFGEVDFTAGHEWTLDKVIAMLLERIAKNPDMFTAEWVVWKGGCAMAIIGKRSDGSPFVQRCDETDEGDEPTDASDDTAPTNASDGEQEPTTPPIRALSPEFHEALESELERKRLRREQKQGIPAFQVADDTGDVFFDAAPGLTLDKVIADRLDRIRNGHPLESDLVIWSGTLLVATICRDEDGNPCVTRFDESAEGETVELGDSPSVAPAEPAVADREWFWADEPTETLQPRLSLVELIEQEAQRLRDRGNAAGDLMSGALAELARVVKIVSADRPDQVAERLSVLEGYTEKALDYELEPQEPEITAGGRIA